MLFLSKFRTIHFCKEPGLFYQEMVFRNQYLGPRHPQDTEVSLFLSPLSGYPQKNSFTEYKSILICPILNQPHSIHPYSPYFTFTFIFLVSEISGFQKYSVYILTSPIREYIKNNFESYHQCLYQQRTYKSISRLWVVFFFFKDLFALRIYSLRRVLKSYVKKLFSLFSYFEFDIKLNFIISIFSQFESFFHNLFCISNLQNMDMY